MPPHYVPTDSAAWEEKLADYLSVRQSVARSDKESWELHVRLGAAEETLLAEPAPDTEAVIAKLKIIWDDDELQSEIDYGRGKRKVLDDLNRLKASSGSPGQTKH
jgi:hypothetical protein